MWHVNLKKILTQLVLSIFTILNSNVVYAMSWSKYKNQDFHVITTDDTNDNVGETRTIYSIIAFSGFRDNLSSTEMRSFLQNALNEVGRTGGVLRLQREKVYTIAIPESKTTNYKYEGGNGLVIPSNVTLDLNGSTIRCESNRFWCYNIIYIPSSSKFAKIQNGIICGDKQTHIIPVDTPALRKSHEWNYGIRIQGSFCVVSNVKICEIRGDGVSITALGEWNHVKSIKASSFIRGRLLKNGRVETKGNEVVSPLIPFKDYDLGRDFYYIKPAFSGDRSDVDWDFNHFFNVVYYNQKKTKVASESVFIGSHMTVPNNAVFFRFSIETTQPERVCNFWIPTYDDLEGTRIEGCEVYNCGRNGINVNVSRDTKVLKTYIHDISGTNNFVGIDIEGTSFLSGNLVVDSCIIEKTQKGASIIASQGNNIIIKNSKLESISGHEDIHIDNCMVSNIYISSPQKKMYVSDNLYPRSTVSNTVVSADITVWNCDVTNCKIIGGGQAKYVSSRYMDYYSPFQVTYNKCTFYAKEGIPKIGPALYTDCKLDYHDLAMGVVSTSDFPVEFQRCSIIAKRIWRPTIVDFTPFIRFDSCSISLSGDYLRFQTDHFNNNDLLSDNSSTPIFLTLSVAGLSEVSNNRITINRGSSRAVMQIEGISGNTVALHRNTILLGKDTNPLSEVVMVKGPIKIDSRNNSVQGVKGLRAFNIIYNK